MIKWAPRSLRDGARRRGTVAASLREARAEEEVGTEGTRGRESIIRCEGTVGAVVSSISVSVHCARSGCRLFPSGAFRPNEVIDFRRPQMGPARSILKMVRA